MKAVSVLLALFAVGKYWNVFRIYPTVVIDVSQPIVQTANINLGFVFDVKIVFYFFASKV